MPSPCTIPRRSHFANRHDGVSTTSRRTQLQKRGEVPPPSAWTAVHLVQKRFGPFNRAAHTSSMVDRFPATRSASRSASHAVPRQHGWPKV